MDQKASLPIVRDDEPSTNVTRQSSLKKIWIKGLLQACLILLILSRLFTIWSSSSLSQLDPTLRAHCQDLLQVPHGYYSSRLDRLVSTLEANDNATWIAEPGASATYYLGGFSKSDWFLSERPLLLVIRPTGKVFILTPAFEQLRAQKVSKTSEIENEWIAWAENENPYEVLFKALGDENEIRLVIDGQVRNFISEGLTEISGVSLAPRQAGKDVSLLRERKDPREVGLLKCANQMTLHAIRETRKRMYMGIRESETRKILDQELAKTGLKGDGGLVLFGGDAALPHGSGTDKKLGREDLVLIDVGGSWGGYTADITRTFALSISRIPDQHLEIWETVRQAQYAPFDLLKRSNSSCPPTFGDLDAAARKTVNAKYSTSGFDIFTHRLGHGIGLEGHERPYLVPGALDHPQAGHVFSLEPGVYVPMGKPAGGLEDVGVRLEDCFVVIEAEDGSLGGEWLSGPVAKWGDI
ncbi:peptidase M24, structural domain-containing protein [Kockovaella imperatae]|uniref:Peptidase M24, structural domain-containing protein n=1 Tax=Kockovaella imperatae TaxID=4999 RepID=A0A1Y1UJZ0_9TREE|nr:peptidase M24, structural domain-containing protein [Kockovaella imperatae]ORX38302.1 peptidase M24, structural domain-containing protein [Kockovaella imperatae]